jgi:hypothetical protein
VKGAQIALLGIGVFLPVASGLGGVLVFCFPSAIWLSNWDQDGQCSASDQPVEVFTSFAVMGGIIACFMLIVFVLHRAVSGWEKK